MTNAVIGGTEGHFSTTLALILGGVGLAGVGLALGSGGGSGSSSGGNNAGTDTTSPTVVISSNKETLKPGEAAIVTFTLSENSVNFTQSDVVVTGGTLSNFIGSGKTYTATFTPTAGQTTGSVSVSSNAFSDVAGNFNQDGADSDNTISLTNTVTTPPVLPTIAITADKAALKAGETANITFTLSEESTDFDLSDVVVTGGTLSSFSGSGSTYSAVFTPTPGDSIGNISVGNTSFSNVTGNFNADGSDANNIVSLALDTVLPTIVLSSDNTILTYGSTAIITFTLSEVSSDFSLSDVVVSGGVLSNFAGSGSSYTATFTPEVGATAASISVASATFSDAAGNFNTDGSDGDNSVVLTIDPLLPTITNTVLDFSRAEDSVVGTLFQATGTNVVSWTLTGVDADKFTIDALGNVTFNAAAAAAIDIENPSDAGKNSVFDLTVNATGISGTVVTKDFVVDITDVTELPVWLSPTASYGTANAGVQSL